MRNPITRLWLCLLFALTLAGSIAAQSAEKPIVILIGPPSSGKTTQAEMIQKQYSFAMITREQLMKDDPSMLARQKQPGVNTVEPRTDPALNGLFLKRLEKTDISKGLLLDGYPTTKDHGDFFTKVIRERSLARPLILKLELSDTILSRSDCKPRLSRPATAISLLSMIVSLSRCRLNWPLPASRVKS